MELQQESQQDKQTGIVRYSPIPQSIKQAVQISQILAQSSFTPPEVRGKPADIFALITHGAQLGLSPTQALQGLALIGGKMCIWGDTALAVARRSPRWAGMEEYYTLGGKRLSAEDVARMRSLPRDELPDDLTAICVIRCNEGGEVVERVGSYSVAQAKNALVFQQGRMSPLWDKPGPWRTDPLRMLQMGARRFPLRDSFADALTGLYLVEEIVGMTDAPAITVQAEEEPQQIQQEPEYRILLERGKKALSALSGKLQPTCESDGQPGYLVSVPTKREPDKMDCITPARLEKIAKMVQDGTPASASALAGLRRRVEALEAILAEHEDGN